MRDSVDRVVHGLLERNVAPWVEPRPVSRVVAEQRPVVVHRQVEDGRRRVAEVARPWRRAGRAWPEAHAELGVGRWRNVSPVRRALIDLELDRLEREADPIVDLVEVVRPAAGVVRVLLDEDLAVACPAGDVVRPRRGNRGVDSVGIDGNREGKRARERHREPREEVTRRLHERDSKRVPLGDDAGGRVRRSVDDVLGSDDVAEVRLRRRVHLSVQRSVDRPLEVSRGDALVRRRREDEIVPQLERVRLAVRRDRRHRRARPPAGAGRPPAPADPGS